MAKKEIEKILTPKGVAQYPWLKNPDTQFNEAGEYKVNLVIPAKEAKDLMATVDGKVKAIFDKTKKEAKPNVRDKITAHTSTPSRMASSSMPRSSLSILVLPSSVVPSCVSTSPPCLTTTLRPSRQA